MLLGYIFTFDPRAFAPICLSLKMQTGAPRAHHSPQRAWDWGSAEFHVLACSRSSWPVRPSSKPIPPVLIHQMRNQRPGQRPQKGSCILPGQAAAGASIFTTRWLPGPEGLDGKNVQDFGKNTKTTPRVKDQLPAQTGQQFDIHLRERHVPFDSGAALLGMYPPQ